MVAHSFLKKCQLFLAVYTPIQPYYRLIQRAKKVVSDSLGLVDFAIGLVILFLTCPTGKGCFWGNSNYSRIVINPANQKRFWG